MQAISFILLRIIDLYSVVLGPHLGGRCRFEPSCSRYAQEAIRQHGPFRGFCLAVARISRCGPWHPGGFDPVPPKHISDTGRLAASGPGL
ncbi:MAG: membrane protein insertion efficiency factor YidD [bacterium]|nr:membrane protein insertion efficiency factor YidD [bacterium]